MEQNFSPADSLHLIQSMISRTRTDLAENKMYFLFWGWLTFLAILGQFCLKVLVGYQHHYLVWLVTIPAAIITIIYSARQERRQKVKTFVGDSMGYLWMGLGISFGVLTFAVTGIPGGWLYCWPFFILFYGLGTFVSGKFIQFTPLVIGGIFNWLLAIAAVFTPFDYDMLLAALAILTSYIIPGHLLPKKK